MAGPNPIGDVVRRGYEGSIRLLTVAQAALDQSERKISDAIAALEEEARGLGRGEYLPPPAPHTRDQTARNVRAGAPLWTLCDFAGNLDEGARAGLEAALEASGLLDAWVTPDGRLSRMVRYDAQLAIDTGAPHQVTAALAGWLLPSVDEKSAVSAEVVARALTLIGAGDGAGPCWVALDGRWQLGPLHGRFGKPSAVHIGEMARQRRRRERLASIAVEVETLNQERARVRFEREKLAARFAAVDRESAAAPSDELARRAHASCAAAKSAVVDLFCKVVQAGEDVALSSAALDHERQARDADARDLGLAEHLADLDGLERRVNAFEVALASLWPTPRRLPPGARKDATDEAGEVTRSQTRSWPARRSVARSAHESRRDGNLNGATLEATFGAGAEVVLLKLSGARSRLKALDAEKEKLGDDKANVSGSRQVAEHAIANYGGKLVEDEARRDEAILGLKRQAAARLLAICDEQLRDVEIGNWSTTTAVEIARRVESRLQKIDSDDSAWERVKRGIFIHFQSLSDALLRHEYSPAATTEDEEPVVTVPFRGRSCTVTELRDAFEDEIAQRSGVLSAREREILENHLVGEVSMQLHELIRAGERWVEGVNAELRDRPTSTGLTLRFDWRQNDDAPAGFAEARKRLLRSSGTWSPTERESLGSFLQQQISAARSANMAGSWQDHLNTALDYRSWHQFVVERQQDGVWKRLTRRTHGTGSSGEKALALTIPQFAAAAAHYRSADPMAPRLILLDEVFVGIDNDMRGKCTWGCLMPSISTSS